MQEAEPIGRGTFRFVFLLPLSDASVRGSADVRPAKWWNASVEDEPPTFGAEGELKVAFHSAVPEDEIQSARSASKTQRHPACLTQ